MGSAIFISTMNGIFGEGGIEHFVNTEMTDTSGKKVKFKAILKAEDECGWALDPEGLGIHCASTGRHKFMLVLSVMICFIILANVGLTFYENLETKKDDPNWEKTGGVAAPLILPLAFIGYLYSLNRDSWNYGTTDFIWGTLTVNNKTGVDIERGPYWDAVHGLEYKTTVGDQIKAIRKETANKLGITGKIKSKIVGKSKVQKKAETKIGDLQQQKRIERGIDKAKAAKDAGVDLIPEIRKETAAKLGIDITTKKGREKLAAGSKFGAVGGESGKTIAGPDGGRMKVAVKGKQYEKAVGATIRGEDVELKKKGKVKVYNENKSKYSRAGNCDVCAGITGELQKGSMSGRCSTMTRCYIAMGIFMSFTVYFGVMGYFAGSDLDLNNMEENDPFNITVTVLNVVMGLICLFSALLMWWSASRCPSGSEFVRRSWIGYDYSFRW